MDILKKIIVMSVFLSVFGMLSACSTVKGFGKDVSQVGKGIQKAAH